MKKSLFTFIGIFLLITGCSLPQENSNASKLLSLAEQSRGITVQWTQIPGKLKQISVGNAGNVWGVNSSNIVYKWTGSTWNEISGALKWVAVGGDGEVWGINASNDIYRRNGNSWTQIPGKLKQISVGNAGNVWGVNDSNTVYKWTGSAWNEISGALKWVAVGGDGEVWGINASNDIYRRNGNSWTQIPGKLKQISVGNAGNIWGVNDSNTIYKWTGSTWSEANGAMSYIAAGNDGEVWGITASNDIYRKAGSSIQTPSPTSQPNTPTPIPNYSSCAACVFSHRSDILPFYQANGWDISEPNWNSILANWCSIDPSACAAEKAICGAICNSSPTSQPTIPPTNPPNGQLTNSKLTIHTSFINGDGESRQFIQAARPRVVKLLDSVNRAAQVKSDSPGTQVVARLYMEYQPGGEWDEAGARAQAQNWWNQFGSTILNNPDVDYWEGLNEPDVGTEGKMAWYNAFETERVAILARNGRRACIGNFSTGTPDVNNAALIQRFYGAIDAARANGGVLGLHEYDAPTMNSTNGWLTLRYRKLYNQYLIPTNRVINLIITECGIDGGVLGRDGGWKSFTNAQDYVNQLQWYDSNLRQDSYVSGATIFSLEIPGWEDFDIGGDVRILLQNYCAQLR